MKWVAEFGPYRVTFNSGDDSKAWAERPLPARIVGDSALFLRWRKAGSAPTAGDAEWST